MKILKIASITLLTTIGIASAYTCFDNNLKTHSIKKEIVNAEVVNITRGYRASTKTIKYTLYLNAEGEKVTISHPKILIRELHNNKDRYIGQTIKIEKAKYYNKKNRLINLDYNLTYK